METFGDIYDSLESKIVGEHRPIDAFEHIWENRSQVFVVGLGRLARSGLQQLENTLIEMFKGSGKEIPKKSLIKAAKNVAPVTLETALRIHFAFLNYQTSGADSSRSIKEFLDRCEFDPGKVFNAPFLVESIYFASCEKIKFAREMKGLTRKEAAKEVWGEMYRPEKHAHTFFHLETEGSKSKLPSDCGYRVTKFLAHRLFDVFRDEFTAMMPDHDDLEWFDVFPSDYTLGPRNGLQTRALARQNCNMLAPITSDQEAIFFPVKRSAVHVG